MPSGYNALAARPKNKLAYPGQDLVEAFTQGLGPMLYGAAKGTAATVAGLPGDIEQLARQLLLSGAAPDSYTAKNMAAQALLPTSDRVRAMLPSLSSFGAGPQAQYTESVAASLGQNIVGNLVAPKALPAIVRAGQGLPVGASIKSVDDNPLMSIPSGLTRAEQANLIQSQAENFAAKAKEMGLSASVEHSGSKAGPSSYVSISDPITGKKFESPFRFSGHSKGPTQNQFVYDVGNDFSKELDLLANMASSIPKAERDSIQIARQAKMLEELALAEKERLFSQGRPAAQKAMQEANLQQAPYTKAFSNSGNFLGPQTRSPR